MVKLLALSRLCGSGIDVLMVQPFLDCARISLGLVCVANGQELVAESTSLQAAKRALEVFVATSSSSREQCDSSSTLKRSVCVCVALHFGAPRPREESEEPVSSSPVLDTELGPVVLDLLLDGLNVLDSLDLNLVHQLQPDHMKAVCLFQFF